MIRLKENFNMELSELLDMDERFVQILDLFEIDNMKRLIEIREDFLAVYLLDAPNRREFNKRKRNVIKYFDTSTLNNELENLLFKEDD